MKFVMSFLSMLMPSRTTVRVGSTILLHFVVATAMNWLLGVRPLEYVLWVTLAEVVLLNIAIRELAEIEDSEPPSPQP